MIWILASLFGTQCINRNTITIERHIPNVLSIFLCFEVGIYRARHVYCPVLYVMNNVGSRGMSLLISYKINRSRPNVLLVYSSPSFSTSVCFKLDMLTRYKSIGADLAGILGGRMARAEGWSVLSGVGYGERCPRSSRLWGLWKRRELPQRGQGQSSGRKRILAYFKGHRTLLFVLYDKIWGGQKFALASPTPNSGGRVPLVPPWSTPMYKSS